MAELMKVLDSGEVDLNIKNSYHRVANEFTDNDKYKLNASLTVVWHDNTLKGSGTSNDPLGVVNQIPYIEGQGIESIDNFTEPGIYGATVSDSLFSTDPVVTIINTKTSNTLLQTVISTKGIMVRKFENNTWENWNTI